MEIYRIKNLTFTYPESIHPALDNVDITINKGEWLLICGKSGCGKTTLLKHLVSVMAPQGKLSGDVIYNGKPLNAVDRLTQSLDIGYVMQNPDNQIVTDKVWHELAFGLESLNYSQSKMSLRISELADYFGIREWFDKNVSELSGGQRQILNLASVMAVNPSVLILDEPTSQLSSEAAQEFLMLLKKIQKDFGTTIITVEHRLESVYELSDHIVLLEEGKVLLDGDRRYAAKNIQAYDYFDAMPVPVRLFSAIKPDSDNLPMNVNEARTMLSEYLMDKDITKCETTYDDQRIYDKSSETVIKASNIWFRYDKNSPDILKGLNFSVQKGALTCILGGNGAGKTTLLSVLTGAGKAHSGSVRIKGKNIKKWDEKKLYGSVLGTLVQNPETMFIKDNVLEDLDSHAKLYGVALERVKELAKLMDIEHLLNMHPYDLSGGEKQRCALCKVLIPEPEIIILDEPTKGYDGYYKKKLACIFKELQKRGITILMVSHDIEFCAEYADICALFFDGNIKAVCGTRDFFAGNIFLTTAANRIARDYFPLAITTEDVISHCLMADTIT